MFSQTHHFGNSFVFSSHKSDFSLFNIDLPWLFFIVFDSPSVLYLFCRDFITGCALSIYLHLVFLNAFLSFLVAPRFRNFRMTDFGMKCLSPGSHLFVSHFSSPLKIVALFSPRVYYRVHTFIWASFIASFNVLFPAAFPPSIARPVRVPPTTRSTSYYHHSSFVYFKTTNILKSICFSLTAFPLATCPTAFWKFLGARRLNNPRWFCLVPPVSLSVSPCVLMRRLSSPILWRHLRQCEKWRIAHKGGR